jgi:hypothetical protein
VKTKPVTVDTLITDYAVTIADAVGITLDADDRTEDGFVGFLGAVLNRLSPLGYERECLTEAIDILRAVQHLGPKDTKTRKRLLTQADRLLYDANEDLQLV